jgi:hypothetical protein
MATAKKSESFLQNDEAFLLEQRKVKALEKLANSVDALTIWFEDIDKEEWSQRIQWYLTEFHRLVPKKEESKEEEQK